MNTNHSTTKRARKVTARTTSRRIEVKLDRTTYGNTDDAVDYGTLDGPNFMARFFDPEGTDVLDRRNEVFGGVSFHRTVEVAVRPHGTGSGGIEIRMTTEDHRGRRHYEVDLFGTNDRDMLALLLDACLDAQAARDAQAVTDSPAKGEPVGSEGCIVLAGVDGPTLWDCECSECVKIQREAQADLDPR